MRLKSLSPFYRRGNRLRRVQYCLEGHTACVRARIWTLVSAGFALGSSLGGESEDNGGDVSHMFSPGTLSTALGRKKGKCSTHSPDDTGASRGLCPKPSLGCCRLALGPTPHTSWFHGSAHPSTGLGWGWAAQGRLFQEAPSLWSPWDQACLALP